MSKSGKSAGKGQHPHQRPPAPKGTAAAAPTAPIATPAAAVPDAAEDALLNSLKEPELPAHLAPSSAAAVEGHSHHLASYPPAAAAAAGHGHSHARNPPNGRPPPPLPDPKLNGPSDYTALIPLTLIALITLFTLYASFPGAAQWAPPVDHSASFHSFSFPGRSLVGGAGVLPSLSEFGGDGAAQVRFSPFMGTGGIVPGTRAFWPLVGARSQLSQLAATLAAHPLAIVAGPHGSGRTSLVERYVESVRLATRAPNVKQIKNPPVGTITPGEYNVIVWVDASTHAALTRTFYDLFAYLRLHALRFDQASVLAGVHAWLLKQDRWLLVFDNCRLPKEELLQYAPPKGGHSIVVLTTDTATASASTSERLLGFDLTASDVVRVHGLPTSAAVKAFTFVSGTFGVEPARRRAFVQLLANHSGALMTAALVLKRRQTTLGLSEMHHAIEGSIGAATSPAARQIAAVDGLLGFVLEEILQRLVAASATSALSARQVEAFLVTTLTTAVRAMPIGSNVLPKEVLLALLSSSSSPSTTPSDLFHALLRELANFGLAAEHTTEYCAGTGAGSECSSRTDVYFPAWAMDRLRTSGAKWTNKKAPDADAWAPFHTLLATPSGPFLPPLLHALGRSSSSGYFVPTTSVVSANPQALAPLKHPYRLYLSATAILMEAGGGGRTTVAANVTASQIVHALRRAYGNADAPATAQEERACEMARGAAILPVLQNMLEQGETTGGAAAQKWAEAARVSAQLLYGAWQLDVQFDGPGALKTFQRALATQLRRGAPPLARTLANPLYPVKLAGKDGLNRRKELVEAHHPTLLLSELPLVPGLATTLQLVGLALTFSQEGGDGSATATNLDARLTLDLALNYHLLAQAVTTSDQAGSTPSSSSDDPLGLVRAAVTSQLGHVYALQRDLEQAKNTYALASSLLSQGGGGPVVNLNETSLAALLTSPDAAGVAAQHRVLNHVRAIRDLTMLAHEESMLFYYDRAHVLHEQAYHLEVGLYGAESPAAAARWLHMGHVAALDQKAPQAHEFYESALEYHKAIFLAHDAASDLRLVQSHVYAGRSHNALGRGRTGKKALEAAQEAMVQALGGEMHLGLTDVWETLGDTCYALGQYQEAMAFYRKLLTMYQTLRGDADAQTQVYKTKVLNMYAVIQQANEEHKRRQQALQQEQIKKLHEVREREAEERRREAQQKQKQDGL